MHYLGKFFGANCRLSYQILKCIKKEELVSICLNGGCDFDINVNCSIIHATANYIGATERFES